MRKQNTLVLCLSLVLLHFYYIFLWLQLYCRSTNCGFSFMALNQCPVNLSTTLVTAVKHAHYAPLTPFATVN